MSENRILDSINSPEDIRRLSNEECQILARELRERVLSIVSILGGHLASSLGVVELTLALHRVYNTPRDLLVWDVGHQAYIHKLITGRKDVFPTLRQWNGISGFLRRSESEFDTFGAGHASTSISAALGMALARDARGDDHKVVAVIGDGAMTGGMSFEALNYAGYLQTDLTVVLNDNERSISNNVGALSVYLKQIKQSSLVNRAKGIFGGEDSPLTQAIEELERRLERSVRELINPENMGEYFQALGFNYLGPIDGHDQRLVEAALKVAKRQKKPTVVHLLTVKGKGYRTSEEDSVKWHGPSAFNKVDWTVKKKAAPPTYQETFAKSLIELAEEDERIVGITAAMATGTGMDKFGARFPKRYHDVGIAEQNAVTMAAGMSIGGLKPVCAIYSTFLQRAYDQIVHDVALQNLDVTFCMDRAGLVGNDGPTHHGVFDIAYLSCLPNIVLAAPRDESYMKPLLRTLLYHPGPGAMRYPRGNGNGVDLEPEPKVAIGKGELLRSGQDVAIVALGSMVSPALEAAEVLADSGIEATVIDAVWAKPMDKELILRAGRECGMVVTIEEAQVRGGFGEAVASLLGTEEVAVKNLGLPDRFIDHGPQAKLREVTGLDARGIADSVRQTVKTALKR